jgi:hypothetical protein
MPSFLHSLFAAALITVAIPSAFAASERNNPPAEERYIPFYEKLPLCDEDRVLRWINHRFERRESRYKETPLALIEYTNIREEDLRPWSSTHIPQRFCSATVTTTDGQKRPLSYAIINGTGLFAVDWTVRWCVQGLQADEPQAECRLGKF